MEADIPKAKAHAAAIGFDAISAYGPGLGGTAQVNIV
jgi:hypothetical protein